jgi:predicted regulator of Ras-like GTPase activity (Roadblock/LC7/MglB family)
MNEEVYASTLRNTLNEIRTACPEVSHAFVFKEDGEILAKDENTDEITIKSAIGSFDDIAERAKAIGGLESVTLYGANGRVNITYINDFFLTTIASKEANEKYVNTLTRIWVPIVLKLVEKIGPASINDGIFENLEPGPAGDKDVEKTTGDTGACEKELPVEPTYGTETKPEPIKEGPDSEANSDSLLPEPPVNQFIVENLGGLLVPSDTVRIDSAIIAQWKDLYSDKEIEEVDVETLNGNTTRCKFKPIKDSKHEGKGMVQMPEKIQFALQTTKGELVMVKPVVE